MINNIKLPSPNSEHTRLKKSANSDTTPPILDFYRPVPLDMSDLPLVFDFDTPADARDYIQQNVDVRAKDYEETFYDRLHLRVWAEQLDSAHYTNVYDLSFKANAVGAKIHIDRNVHSVSDFMAGYPESIAAVSGAFLYLADKSSGTPRQPALNLALKAGGMLCSIPVVDREALIASSSGLSVRHLRAMGEVAIDDRILTWSGSRTEHESDCKIFGNGNIVIEHFMNEDKGARKQRIRVLDESSRCTPPIHDDQVDIGLIAASNGHFRVQELSQAGMDLFAYDAVMRCSRQYVPKGTGTSVRFHTIDTLPIGNSADAAITVGPMLGDTDFAAHTINNDPSLGSDPPFIDVRMVRLALYMTADERLHVRLFDGRPESENFKGVTPKEAVENIYRDGEVVWGCFLDPGRTAKICTRIGNTIMSYGNAHYLRWPSATGGTYKWVPSDGRPIPSVIILE